MNARRLALTLILCLSATNAFADVDLQLRESVQVTSGYVRLQQIANVDAAYESARLRRIFVGPAPDKGETRRFTRSFIETRLRDNGVRGAIRFSGATAVNVQTIAKTSATKAQVETTNSSLQNASDLAEQTFRTMLENAILVHLQKQINRSDIEVSISRLRVQEGQALSSARSFCIQDIRQGRLPGYATITFSALNARGEAFGSPLVVALDADVTVPVWMLRRPLRTGDKVMKQDLILKRTRLSDTSATYLLDAAAVLGQAATRHLRPMTALCCGDFEQPPVVKQGQVVVVDTISGGFQVRHYAKALATAKAGELLMVENASSKKKYMVRALARDTVAMPDDPRFSEGETR